jgi:hypothetical protein
MHSRRAARALVLGFALATVFTTTVVVRAEIPREPPPAQENTLQAVLDRIHEHAKDEAWRQGGWQDEKIEKWLDKLVGAIAKGADLPDLKVPVRLAELQPADPARPILGAGSLLIGKDLKRVLSARNSVILADGNVELGIPQDSVIIARGAVSVMGAKNCVIVSGTYITSSHDGEPGGGGMGSVLVSRGWLDIRSAHGSILLAGEGLAVERSENAVFVNRALPEPVDRLPRHNGSRSVKAPDVPLEPLPVHPLSGKIKLLGMIQQPANPAGLMMPVRGGPVGGVVFRFGDRRYVADLNEPIVDEAGQPVEGLGNWRLTFVADRLAVFGKGESQAVVRLAEAQ